jgi:hypothetical protein
MTPKSLREGFELYKKGKPFGKPDDGPRHAMFGLVVDEIEALKESIGTQVSVADLLKRIEAMELTIGNALRAAPALPPVMKPTIAELEAILAEPDHPSVQILPDGSVQIGNQPGERQAKRSPGRPRKEAA